MVKKGIVLVLVSITLMCSVSCAGNNITADADETGNVEQPSGDEADEETKSEEQESDEEATEDVETKEQESKEEKGEEAEDLKTEETKTDSNVFKDQQVSAYTEYPQLKVDWEMKEERTSNKTIVYNGHFEEVLLTEESSKSFPELAKAIKEEADTARAAYEEEEEQIIKDAKERFEEQPDFFSYGGYSDNVSAYIRRADDKVVSYTMLFDNYQGGAHGIYGENSITFDAKTGKKLSLTDVMTDSSGLSDLLADKIKEKYSDDEYFDMIDENIQLYDVSLTEYDPDGDRYPYNWSMNPTGIRFYFGPYELGPYAAGDKDVTIPYSEIENVLIPDYIPDEDNRVIYKFTDHIEIFDVTGDGKLDKISLSAVNPKEEYNMAEGVLVSINENDVESDLEADNIYDNGSRTGYYIRTTDGRQYIYAYAYIDDECPAFLVYDINDGEPWFVGHDTLEAAYEPSAEEGLIESRNCLTDPEKMELSKEFYTIATYNGVRTYRVGEDGMPESDERYVIRMFIPDAQITSVQEMKCDIVDEEGNVLSKQETIPSGETFSLLYTDGDSWIDAKMTDGRIARLILSEEEDLQYKVNGIPAEDLFEALPLVG